jgi:surface protein
MAIRSEGIDLTVQGIYKMTEAVDGMALDVKGGTLTLVGSFTLRGSVNGVEVDNNVSVRGLLRSYGTSGAGIHYVGTVDDRKLTLVPGFVSPTLVELTGSTAALSYTDGHYFRITTNGCCLAEPVGGIISPMPYDILDSNHDTATHVVLTLKGTAAGVGTESDPYQINSAEDWAKACEDVTYGCSTAGKYFRICSSFTATSVMGPLGNPFAGVIDGGSEFFTVTADIDEEYVGTALFHSVSDATIRDLCVKGSIRGGNGSAGIVGEAVGGATTMENCVFSGTVSTVDGSPADNWIVGAKAEGATVTTVNCLDASQHHWGDGSRAYSVTGGTNISLTKTGETGIAYDKAIWAPKDATVQFITAGGVGPYAPTAGTLSGPEGGVYSLTMPEEDVLILPNSWVSHTISYPGKDDENPMVTGGTVSVRSSAPAGTSILINVTPDPYYLLDELTVTTDPGGGAAGEPVEVDYDHFFRMPASNVKVTATFKKKYSLENGVLTLKYGTFNKLGTNAFGDDVIWHKGEVTKITADPGVRFTEDCGGLFSGFTECTEIDLSNVETSALESTANMFGGCKKLKSLNMNGWNTARVRDMSDMFYGCSELGELDLSGFVFAAGVDVTGMFSLNGLYKLTLPPAFSVTKEMELNKGNHDDHWNYSGWQLLGNRNVVSTVSDAVYDSNNDPFTYAQLPGQLTAPTFVWKEMPDDFILELPDGEDNRDLIALWDGMTVNVKLTGRTLYKDGYWNTLCLPFTLSAALDASYPIISSADYMVLDVTGKYNAAGDRFDNKLDGMNEEDFTLHTGFDEATGTLNLYFMTPESYEPSTPHIICWYGGGTIESPTFNHVTITKTLNDVNSDDGIVTFRGTYDYRSFPDTDRSILFLGSNNTLFYPESSARIGAFRSYFKLVGVTAGDPLTNIKMYFGDDDTTAITTPLFEREGSGVSHNEAGAWYDLSGRKIKDERLEMRDSHSSSIIHHPSSLKKGVYIHGGRKVVVK